MILRSDHTKLLRIRRGVGSCFADRAVAARKGRDNHKDDDTPHRSTADGMHAQFQVYATIRRLHQHSKQTRHYL